MRLFVIDPRTNKKTYLKKSARTRKELSKMIGSSHLKVNGQVYAIQTVNAEPTQNTATAVAVGGGVGVIGGIPGLIIGAAIGGLIGKNKDSEDQKLAEEFNRS
jgi:hypothetical protein